MAWVKIEKEEDTKRVRNFLFGITTVFLIAGGGSVYFGINGALVASTGMVVAVTTPLFASALGQLADYSAAARQLLFHYRSEKSVGLTVGNVSFSEEGKQSFIDAQTSVNTAIDEYEKHESSLRRGSNRLITTQSWIVGICALVASFGDYAQNALNCGKISC